MIILFLPFDTLRHVPIPKLLGFGVLDIGYSFGFWVVSGLGVWGFGWFWVSFWDLGFNASLKLC